MALEIRRLNQENAYLRRQRDILKNGIIKLGTKYLLTTAILGLPYCSVKWTPGSSRVGPPAE